mmetsp:Transcript_5034/g.7477  ORF Transcript_5034/g.7477 Transcript_5034/m.7477 type:complete len:760 (-) Transcript_5034:21-2300(-)
MLKINQNKLLKQLVQRHVAQLSTNQKMGEVNTVRHYQRVKNIHTQRIMKYTVPQNIERGYKSTQLTLTNGNEEVAKNPLFEKILIANRGEIACRIISTCKKLGIETVAVYSEADAKSRFVEMADEAFCIGKAESAKSYLRGDVILEIAKKHGVQAIHPGYGFLSENSEFAVKCDKAGIKFIGPPIEAIEAMGDKRASKEIMIKANVATVPGYHGADQSTELLQEESRKMGYPVMIKAIMGGGGKGMRIVHDDASFQAQLSAAKNEAMSSFGDDRVLIEKFITRPRHVEIQVFGDQLDNYVYLFERDCSVQRRMQKIIEEAPAPGLSDELRRQMGESAVDAARAVNYEGAGTVEFIMDLDNNAYYFMEMNTRLQVEHPVTELITNQDLVRWQIEVASGNRVPLQQDELECTGHAFEARIYAEKPIFSEETNSINFTPATGTLHYLSTPQEDLEQKEVRVDTGVRQGDDVSIYYDPMIAKLIVHSSNRDLALKKLKNALDDYHIAGVPTNIPFLKALATHPEFQSANLDTNFIPNYQDQLMDRVNNIFSIPDADVFASIALLLRYQNNAEEVSGRTNMNDPFNSLGSFNVNADRLIPVRFQGKDDEPHTVHISGREGSFTIHGDTPRHFESCTYNGQELIAVERHGETARTRHRLTVIRHEDQMFVFSKQGSRTIKLFKEAIGENEAESAGTLISPMPGKVVEVFVKENDTVKKGDPLLVLEAMKMQNTMYAPHDGVVKRILAESSLVGADEIVCDIETEE